MKIPESVYMILHTKACGRVGVDRHSSFLTAGEAAWSRERDCQSEKGRIYGCRLIRYDRQVFATLETQAEEDRRES